MVIEKKIILIKNKLFPRNKNDLKIKYIISVIISLMITLLIIGNILKLNFLKSETNYIAENGILNIQNWDPAKEENIKLDGEWRFYPHTLLDPSQKETKDNLLEKYIEVPSSWESNGYINESGTYRLVIKVPEDRVYGIKTKTIRSASRIYFNGEEVMSMGNPSLDRENFNPESKYKIAMGSSSNKEIELVIQVSSYEYRVGGILKSIEFGTSETIMNTNNKDRAMDALIISVCLVLGIYFLLTYIQRQKEKHFGYFSGMCFFMGIYLSTMNEQLLDLVYTYDWIARIRIQILLMIMIMICVLKFIHHFFYEYVNKRTMGIIVKIMLMMIILTFNNPKNPLSITMGYVQAIVLTSLAISYGYIFWILLKAIYNKVDSLEYIIVITNAMFLYWITISIKIFFEIDLGHTSMILIFIIMISIALLMNRRLQLDYEQVNNLSEKLIMYDRLKDEFLAKASHELRTPLYIILNLTKFLLEGRKGSLNSKQQEDLYFIHQEGQRLSRLVEDLLDASQVKKGEIKLRLSPINPYTIVEDILKEMKILIPKDKQIILKNRIPKEFPALKLDSDKFRQIIYNLVHNAIKYTESGEVSITASLEYEQAIIKVSDTGIGIEEKYLKDVFNTFYQKNKNDKSNQGLGLGLSIVKQLVEGHGGNISVESVYKKGSTFKITLPIYEGEIEEKDKLMSYQYNTYEPETLLDLNMKKESENNIERQTVLIVDDEPLNQKVLEYVIDQMGLNTLIAYNGAETLDIIEKNKVDLIILDFMLPDMSGDEVCKKIRQKYTMAELPIMILTASGKTIDLMNAFDYGANDFQKKTSNTEELKTRINSLLLMKKSVEDGLKKEFQYFYSQISPHFLYNTLNTIIGLSYKDTNKARKALNNLSTYFRGKLDVHQSECLISLESELELVTAYLEIEQIRYGERLKVEYDIEGELRAMIPPLTLQPLVENSVNHGIKNKSDAGKIKISIYRERSGFISITIEDNGIGIDFEKQRELLSGKSQRIGFSNVMNKIKILKGAELTLESKPYEYTRVKIIIPETKNHER
ncbi:two-component system sensor histidine kinase [Gottschalkia acidurici 9a]|uniref:histidine kinase n=1 Tax=Gottschalkia acidurici (strain ATCC 7906 / DSM 604 / BCRC 14475 / CIP 104303 / KCTC 5404 / NCIMB 10678 / 9a) TaxID=1128398 RepID=K0B0Q2_GOTA9|nr:ATP-binding protein [Gottschalkia acidurici]AFS79104.1 two-component system sensor histidine kinase [Gottschalkia acidurici 9a]